MSEKIRALRKTLESTGKAPAQASQQAYGKLARRARLVEQAHHLCRPIPRKEQKDATSDHHDFLFPYRFDHNVECQEIPRTRSVSVNLSLSSRMW